jgi:6-phosphofructokinase
MQDSTASPPVPPCRKVAILFAGGPAPAANAVISTAAASFLKHGIPVVGILHGYSRLVGYQPKEGLVEGRHYIMLDQQRLKRTRNTQGILIGTARTNPGSEIWHPAHLRDPERTAKLRTIYEALRSLEVDALISIGGDDTLTTANKFQRFQYYLPEGSPRIRVVHVPKTIDNDYEGIDFTFGYFTAADTLATEIRNLLADAEASSMYFLAETMGRRAGWLAYGAAIAGEASLVLGPEDVYGQYADFEPAIDPITQQPYERRIMNVDAVVRRIVATMRAREEREGKHFGVIVMAEGLADFLPAAHLQGVPRDEHGHIAFSQVNLGRKFAAWVAEEYKRQTQRQRKVVGLQLGYETRCARPHAFDVMLGSQLGVGAYRVLVEAKEDGVMISVRGQLELHWVPFDQLIDQETLRARVRYIDLKSDFHKLARFLETEVDG